MFAKLIDVLGGKKKAKMREEQERKRQLELERKKQEEQEEQKRREFINTYGLCINPDSPNDKPYTSWKWDKRYNIANICDTKGFCYLVKVQNTSEYMERFMSGMSNMGISQIALWVHEPSGELEEQFEKLPLF